MAGTTDVSSLTNFSLKNLSPYVRGGVFPSKSTDHLLLLVGLDDVHGALKYILNGVTHELHLNMFGYDDEELNDIIWSKVMDPNILVRITLDKSQAGGVHEAKLLETDKSKNLSLFNTHFAIGQSDTHQISHTKGFVADGIIGCHGSTNWSSSGEGTFVSGKDAGGTGYKAQNNTQSFFTDIWSVNRFRTKLISEHDIAIKQNSK